MQCTAHIMAKLESNQNVCLIDYWSNPAAH